MPAKSKAQQRLFGMALAVRKGELKRNEVNKEVLDIVDGKMTDKEIEDFAATKHDGLKKYVKENIMKDLKEFLNESLNEGASLDQRNVDRFFGDIYNRPMSVKKYQMQSKQTLNNLKSEFSSEEYDMLYKLAYNREGEYGRSYINMDNFDYKGIDFYAFSFDLHAANMPKSLTNALDRISTKYSMLVCDLNKGQFGIDHHIYGRISVDRFEKANEGIETKGEFVEAVKEFLSIIKPFYNDIISYRDEDRDADELNRRK